MINTVDIERYKKHLRDSGKIVNKAQWQDQFMLEITRESPDFKELDPLHVKSYTFQYDGVIVDTTKIGSGYINQINGVEPLSISVVFRESVSDDITNFLLKKDNGDFITPRDGTYLLPYEYYFNISAYSLDAEWNPKLLVSGEFLFSGQVTRDFISEGGNMQEITAEFKPINSNQLKFK